MSQLSGKIHWINHDFSFYGCEKVLTRDEVYYTVTKVTNFVMDENMISFYTAPYEYQGDTYAYKVNLLAGNRDYIYTGYANYVEGGRVDGSISCQVYNHNDRIMLHG